MNHPKYAWLIWLVGGVGVLLAIVDHWAHFLGVLPYLLILACPIMHLVMHRGHRHGQRAKDLPGPAQEP